jgi:predicted ester cyclase
MHGQRIELRELPSRVGGTMAAQALASAGQRLRLFQALHSQKGSVLMPEEENKALARRYFEDVANKGDFSVADEIVTAEYVEGVKQLITRLHTAFPDFHMVIEDQIAEGDKVVTRFTASGTHQGIWQSPIGALEPTGKRFQHEGIRIFRVMNGKLVETWGGADTLSQLQQLGVLHALVAQQDKAPE